MKTVKEVLDWFEYLYSSGAIYVWGANGEIINQSLIDKCYKNYKSNTYNKTYYDNKLKEGKGKIGADCSGAFCKVSGFDTTAKNYYAKCITKGNIKNIPENKVCLVFRGSSPSSIYHIGLYCGNGYTIEMKSSKENCVKSKFSKSNWTYYGMPTWIDYGTNYTDFSNKLIGIDVSRHQEGKINYNELKKAGFSFVFARCGIRKSSGIVKDEYFDHNYIEATKAGLYFGTYIYSRATTTAMAEEEADKVYEWCKDKKLTYPVAFDIEDNVMKNKNATDITLAFIRRMNHYGYPAILYTGESFYNSYFDNSRLIGVKKWIAKYGKNDGSVNNPNIGTSVAVHQFTSNEVNTAYYKGNLDRNISYEDLSKMYDKFIVQDDNSSNDKSVIKNIVTASELNIRKSYTTRSEIVGKLSKGECVDILGYIDGWYLIDRGYISEKYVSSTEGKVTASWLNFRTSASVKPDNIIKAYKSGTKVKLLRESGNWYFTPLGWCSKKYISIV